jgi:putative transposase
VAHPGKAPDPKKSGRYAPLELKLAVAKAYEAKQATAAELGKVYGVATSRVFAWARLFREKGEAGLEKKSRKSSRERSPVQKQVAEAILETKKTFGWFGVPRITQWLRRAKFLPVTEHQVSKTLKEAELVPKKPRKRRRAEVVRRFERAEPNQLWQTDITMWTMAKGQKVYLIAFMDDHSRYVVGWGLYAAQGSLQVMEVLRNAIGQYGTPKEILSDQGRQYYSWRGKCVFQKELLREGIHHVVSRSHHPQTLGKVEAFWKHLKEEFLSRVVTGSINDLRERLRFWIESHYNFQRPHQGIDNATPADRYFKMAAQVREVIEKGVAKNAEQLSLGREVIKPFYLAGRMGDQEVTIQQEGTNVVMNVGNREVEKVQLSEEERHEEKKPGIEGGSGSAGGQGQGPGGPAVAVGGEDHHGDLPGDGAQAHSVLQAGRPDDQRHDLRGSVELGEAKGPQPPHGDIEPRGAQPPAPAGESSSSVDAPIDPKALPGGEKAPGTGAPPGETPAEGGVPGNVGVSE